MKQAFSLLMVIFLVAPAIAKDLDPIPKAAEAVAAETLEVPGIRKDPALKDPKAHKKAKPPKHKFDPKLRSNDPNLGKLAPSVPEKGIGEGKNRVPLSGPAPIANEAVERSARPPSLTRQLANPESIHSALTHQLRLDGRTGRVDFRGQDRAVARLDWQLDATESDLAFISVMRSGAGRCPPAGMSVDLVTADLRWDSNAIVFDGFVYTKGGYRIDFSAGPYRGLTDVYIQVCGIRGNTLNGVRSNVVHVQLGSANRVIRLPVARWSVEWSYDFDYNAACISPPRRRGIGTFPAATPIGFKNEITRGNGPIPCNSDAFWVYQPSARFDLTGLPRHARIIRADLRFTENSVERRSESGRLCAGATLSVGLATTPVGTQHRTVGAVSGSAGDARSLVSAGGSQRSLDVAGWLESWLGGRAADVTFIGLRAQRIGGACLSELADVHIDVEYEATRMLEAR